MAHRLYMTHESLTHTSSAYEGQTFVQTRLDPWPAARVNVATVGKVRDVESYTVIPALRFAETIGHGNTFKSWTAVRKWLRTAITEGGSNGS